MNSINLSETELNPGFSQEQRRDDIYEDIQPDIIYSNGGGGGGGTNNTENIIYKGNDARFTIQYKSFNITNVKPESPILAYNPAAARTISCIVNINVLYLLLKTSAAYEIDGPNDPLADGNYNINLNVYVSPVTGGNSSFLSKITLLAQGAPLIYNGYSGSIIFFGDIPKNQSLPSGDYKIVAELWATAETVEKSYITPTYTTESSTYINIVSQEPSVTNIDTYEYSLGGVSNNYKIAYDEKYKFTPFLYYGVSSNRIKGEYDIYRQDNIGYYELTHNGGLDDEDYIQNLNFSENTEIIITNRNTSGEQKTITLILIVNEIYNEQSDSYEQLPQPYIYYISLILSPKENSLITQDVPKFVNNSNTNIIENGGLINFTISTSETVISNIIPNVSGTTSGLNYEIKLFKKTGGTSYTGTISNNSLLSITGLITVSFNVILDDGTTQVISNLKFYLLPKIESGTYMIKIKVKANVPRTDDFDEENAGTEFIINNIKFN